MRKPVLFIVGILLLLLIAAFAFLLRASRDQSSTVMLQKQVFILRNKDSYTLYRSGQPFFIKGAAGTSNIQELAAAGGNTIRTWDTLNLRSILDSAYAHGIAVIAGLSLPVSSTQSFYDDTSRVAGQYDAYRQVVQQYRTHPALLMWCLGNEVDFPYKLRFRRFYKVYNRLLDMIHEEDPDHPVTTALTNFDRRCIYNIKIKVHGLDLLSLNTFGKLPLLSQELDDFSWFWNGPFLISEWGINGPWESEATAWGAPIENTSTKKAEQYLERYQYMPVKSPRFLGACVFFWGQKQEGTHTWFSFFTRNGKASEMTGIMEQIWTGKAPPAHAPPLKYMLLEGKGARDNILLKPGSRYEAEILLEGKPQDSLQMQWEILEEDWFRKNIRDFNTKKPAAFDSLILSCKKGKLVFRTPPAEGPYRLFVTVYNNKGYFSTANTPFYVVD